MAFQGDSIYWVEVEKVVPNPFQPRREFDQSKLQELADSIRMYGVLQPLTVTRSEIQRDDGTFYTEYELIAGERRLRASKLAGVAQVPVIIREGEQNEQEKLELAIIENLQREDLNAVDRAVAFKQLAETFGLSHTQVAKKVGRSREYVSNSIRLLGLPEHMQEAMKTGDLMEGHARTLLMLCDKPDEQEVVFREILLKKMSVREVERIVRRLATDKIRKKENNDFDANIIEMEKQFTESLGTRVQIQKTDFGGKLTIDYFSEDDLNDILRKVREERNDELNQGLGATAITENTPLDITQSESKTEETNTPEPTEPDRSNASVSELISELSELEKTEDELESEPATEPEPAESSESNNVEEEEVDHDIMMPLDHDLPEEDLVQAVNDEKTDSVELNTPQNDDFSNLENGEPVKQEANQNNPEANHQSDNQDTPDSTEGNDKTKPKPEDDSNLYSINNFTI